MEDAEKLQLLDEEAEQLQEALIELETKKVDLERKLFDNYKQQQQIIRQIIASSVTGS